MGGLNFCSGETRGSPGCLSPATSMFIVALTGSFVHIVALSSTSMPIEEFLVGREDKLVAQQHLLLSAFSVQPTFIPPRTIRATRLLAPILWNF
jgi:hypothetical protein